MSRQEILRTSRGAGATRADRIAASAVAAVRMMIIIGYAGIAGALMLQ